MRNCNSLLLISTPATSDQASFKNQQNRAEATNPGKLNQKLIPKRQQWLPQL